jgi:rRNA processing protein Krr1/Pno1
MLNDEIGLKNINIKNLANKKMKNNQRKKKKNIIGKNDGG